MTIISFSFDWNNFCMGLVIAITLESLMGHPWRMNSLSIAMFLATITPFLSLIMRNGIINPDVPVNIPLIIFDSFVYIAMLDAILYVYQFRLRIFDSSNGGGVRLTPFDWCIFGSQTFWCVLDMILVYHLPRTGILPTWVGTTYNAVIYIIEVLHELAVDIMLLIALWRNVRTHPSYRNGNSVSKLDNAYMWDMLHLAFTIVLTITLDTAIIFMNWYLAPSYFLSTKRLGYAIKVRLALSMFKAIKDHRVAIKNRTQNSSSGGAGASSLHNQHSIDAVNKNRASSFNKGASIDANNRDDASSTAHLYPRDIGMMPIGDENAEAAGSDMGYSSTDLKRLAVDNRW